MTSRPRVLLVEPNPDLSDLNRLILEDAGYCVETLPPNADAVAVVLKTHPDCVVADIRPQRPEDWDVVDRLQANPMTEAIPVVIVASVDRAAVEALAAPNVRQAIVMPYDIDALQKAVAEALHNPPPAAILPPPRSSPPPEIEAVARILNENARHITLRTVGRLLQIEPFKSQFRELTPELMDSLPIIYGALAVGLHRNLPPDEVVASIDRNIWDHVKLRVSQGLKPASAVQEYEILFDEILRFLEEQENLTSFSPTSVFHIVRTIHSFVGGIVLQAVNLYAERIGQVNAPGGGTPEQGHSTSTHPSGEISG